MLALAQAAVANGADALGMAGGDGSLAVVAAAAAAHDLPFVCVPAETRNHFALDVGVDRHDAIYFEHDGPCKDSTRHRRCPGRWRGEIITGRSPEGRRLRRRVSGLSKAAVQDALKSLRKEIDGGISAAPANYTVRRCCEDWIADGLPGRDPKTIAKNRYVLEPLLTVIGASGCGTWTSPMSTRRWPRSPRRGAARRSRWRTWP